MNRAYSKSGAALAKNERIWNSNNLLKRREEFHEPGVKQTEPTTGKKKYEENTSFGRVTKKWLPKSNKKNHFYF
jgi:hypothetical protein